MDLELSISTPGDPSPGRDGPVHKKTSESRATSSKTYILVALTLIAFASMALATLAMNGFVLATQWRPREPPLPGVMPGEERPKLILAADIDYPPYTRLGTAAENFEVRGFGRDVAVGLKEVCDIDVEVVQTDWSQCWSNNKIGPGMLDGHFHGCMTYTHAKGVRNRYLEFSKPILQLNKHAGVITRLNPDGTPVVKPSSNLKGVKVVDVVGWAPTQDGLAFVENRCDRRNRFSGYELIAPTFNTGNANDDALRTLLDGSADAVWIYADQAFNYKCPADGSKTAWNCTMWERLGTDFAYIHTGMLLYAYGGTTLSMSRRGSGVPAILNPCIEKFLETESYYKVCKENQLEKSCFPNSYFPQASSTNYAKYPFKQVTDRQAASCSDGYCPCD